jgi:hypothetical protein
VGVTLFTAEHKALLALAEEVPGVVSVSDEPIPTHQRLLAQVTSLPIAK